MAIGDTYDGISIHSPRMGRDIVFFDEADVI